jgi:hypothetical protein
VWNEFSDWIKKHCPVGKTVIGTICGNWDILTQIPKQCGISEISIPEFCNE